MKQNDNLKYMALLLAVVVVVGGGVFFMMGGGSQSTIDGGITDPITGDLIAPWTNTLVNYKLIVSDVFTGANVPATMKVYDEKPEDWGNARGTFTEAKDYTIYTTTEEAITVNKEFPGTYFGVMTADGYNTEFIEFTIPNGDGRGDIADYQSNPDSMVSEMALVGTTSIENIEFDLVNATSKTIKKTLLLPIDENTEFRGWKVIVKDIMEFSIDENGNGVYDEGISKLTLSVAGQSVIIFDPSKGTDEFDSNDEYTILLEGIVVSDEADFEIKVEIEADATGDYTGANDEVLGEGDGTIASIKIYDAEGTLLGTPLIVA